MHVYKTFSLFFFTVLLFEISALHGQEKRKIDHTVYDSWKDVKNPVLSSSGGYVAYEINPQKGDGVLYVYDAASKETVKFGRGEKPAFSGKSNFVVFNIVPQFDTVRQAKLKKVKKDDLPKDSIGIYTLENGKLRKYEKLKNFRLPEDESDWFAFLMEKPKQKKDENDTTKVKKEKKSKKKKDEGDLLVLMNPISGDSASYDRVSKYAVSENGKTIAFLRISHDSIDSVSVNIYDTQSMKLKTAFHQPGFSENISIDEKGNQIAFSYSPDTSETKVFQLYYLKTNQDEPKLIQEASIKQLPAGWTFSHNGAIYFNEQGNELFFGTAMKPESKPKDTLTEDEKVSLDIWTWNDPLLQPHQLKELPKEEKRTWLAVYFPTKDEAVQLGSENLQDVVVDKKSKGFLSLAYDKMDYRKMLSWDASRYKDVYLINRESGESKFAIGKAASSVSLSPGQKYIAWYAITDSSWYVYDVESTLNSNVTSAIGVPFYDELNDVPEEAGPYGMAGWTKDQQLVIYDRFDLWLIDPTGKKEAVCLTNGNGRKSKNQFRYVKLDKEEIYMPDELMLSAFNEENKQAGFYNLNMNDGTLKGLEYGPYHYPSIQKAKDAKYIIWQKESFSEYPNLHYSDTWFNNAVKLTNANPQQAEYNWGTTELVDWITFDGDTMQGILVKPENFDPNKKYPMLVYFYERVSDRLNWYYIPKPIRSVINWTYYASNEYLIFIPDIKYKTGYPGPSAYNCIVSGTQAMCNRYPFIDRNRLGIQGQSWGGYQTAWVITQTNMFKAAMAGAPVSNMTSAYGGIRWESGLSRAFQYEESQSRIGGTLWEKRDLYILNSPIFFADQIETPLLIMHNDADGAVPWYQGIEFFSALRRLNKPVWMLVYNNAPHNLKRRADSEDLTIRMQQFFDFYLKDAPEPSWMKEGVPAIKKGEEFGFEIIEE